MMIHRPSQLVPRLRFPEFQNAPAWSVEPLGRLFGERQETGFSELPLLSVTDRDGVVLQEETNRKITANANRTKYLRVVPGDIVYNTMRMWEGRSARVGIEGVVSPAYTVCRPNEQTNSYFFAYYFKTSPMIQQFRKYSQGLVKDTLNLKFWAFSPIQAVYPVPNEQQKVAECLGSLDELIAAEDRNLETLRQHKQGLMQQLFPQPGETTPRLRFSEFRDGPEWSLRTLSSAGEVNPPNHGLPELFIYIDLESVKSSMLIERKEITKDVAPSRAQRLLNRKDIIFQTVRPYQRNNLFFDIDDGCEYVASTGYAQLRAYESPEFLYQLLHTDSFVSSVLTRCTGSNYPAINPSALASIEVAMPRNAEQQHIASCLGSLDELIVAKGRKLEAMRQHKQGLMQQLFPSLDG